MNVRTGFLDPVNMGKGTKVDFLSQILRKLWGIEYLAHLPQAACHVHAYVHAWCSTVRFKYCAYCNISDHLRDSLCYLIIRVKANIVYIYICTMSACTYAWRSTVGVKSM